MIMRIVLGCDIEDYIVEGNRMRCSNENEIEERISIDRRL